MNIMNFTFVQICKCKRKIFI